MTAQEREQDVIDDLALDMMSDRLRHIQTREVLEIGRLTHRHLGVDYNGDDYLRDDVEKPPVVSVKKGANVVSSLLTNGKHAPAIDLDIKARLVPSSTPGHSHLYIDHELTWEQYRKLLEVMRDLGLVQEGFYKSAVRRGTTFLRLPHVRKPNE